MKIIRTRETLLQAIKQLKKEGKTIGFVPTMGYLHEGHLTLVSESVKQQEVTIMSIFVNPTQFGPNEDFDQYPRDEARDIALAEQAQVEYLFMPSVAEMYPEAAGSFIQIEAQAIVLDGAQRPGHFNGVAMILAKLFHLIQPDAVYMGQKDAQQVAIVQRLVTDYFFQTEIVPVPTVREVDGLAKSSRNVYLTEAERSGAPAIYEGLKLAEQAIDAGETSIEKVLELVQHHIDDQAPHKGIDYLSFFSYPSFEPLQEFSGTFILAVAVKFSKARLIDNKIFNK